MEPQLLACFLYFYFMYFRSMVQPLKQIRYLTLLVISRDLHVLDPSGDENVLSDIKTVPAKSQET